MRFTITSFVILLGLMFTAAAHAGDAAKAEEAETITPPVEASPPDTPVATPASPAPAESDEAEGAAEE